jgi:DNA-binding transcriptional ArsR family regulator
MIRQQSDEPSRYTSGAKSIGKKAASLYSSWFKALSDANRILILNVLAGEPAGLSIGDLVARFDIGQSTISHHVARLAAVRFVFTEQRGRVTIVTVNRSCLSSFPNAASEIMRGRKL